MRYLALDDLILFVALPSLAYALFRIVEVTHHTDQKEAPPRGYDNTLILNLCEMIVFICILALFELSAYATGIPFWGYRFNQLGAVVQTIYLLMAVALSTVLIGMIPLKILHWTLQQSIYKTKKNAIIPVEVTFFALSLLAGLVGLCMMIGLGFGQVVISYFVLATALSVGGLVYVASGRKSFLRDYSQNSRIAFGTFMLTVMMFDLSLQSQWMGELSTIEPRLATVFTGLQYIAAVILVAITLWTISSGKESIQTEQSLDTLLPEKPKVERHLTDTNDRDAELEAYEEEMRQRLNS